MTRKAIEGKRPVKTTAIVCFIPHRVSRRGRVNEGRPPKFVTVDQLVKRAAEYFHTQDNRIKTVSVDENGHPVTARVPAPYTIEGLVDFLGIYRDTLHGWERGERGPEFSDAVKGCKRKIRADWAVRVQESKNPAGIIFYGKAALGYRDIQTIEQAGLDGGPIQSQNKIIFEFRDTTVKDDPDLTENH